MKSGNETFDLVIAGGGIFGLWVAKHSVDLGLKVLVAEERQIGAGASGGLLGALMPYIPMGWVEKKQFQFDALSELSDILCELEADTGQKTGYGRIGRLMPLRKERFVSIAKEREKAARTLWEKPPFQYMVSSVDDRRFSGWLDEDYAPYGFVLDTLAARINPRAYLNTLATYLNRHNIIREGLSFDGLRDGIAYFNKGCEQVKTGAVVLAQGYKTFSHLQNTHGLDIGAGVKGQAATFKLVTPSRYPVLYDDGVYIVPHENGTCSVGSTAEKNWDHPTRPDLSETGFIEKACAICPPLRDAPLIERWAGVRPKCHKREPIAGRLLADQEIYIATGGFKVSFGIAHRVAEALVDEILNRESRVLLPEKFRIDYHIEDRSD